MASSSTTTTVSNHDAQWEWEGDGGHWQQYPVDVQQTLSQAFDAGKKEVNSFVHQTSYTPRPLHYQVDIDISDGLSMTVKFPDMVQMNKETNFLRRIRLCLESKGQSGFYVYEWQNENKKWEAYSAEVMVKIIDAVNTDQTSLSVTCETRTYTIDLKKLTQINTSTHVTRKIRALKSSLLQSLFNPCTSMFISLVARVPPSSSTPSSKRPLEAEEPTETRTKKRAVSKSVPEETTSSKSK